MKYPDWDDKQDGSRFWIHDDPPRDGFHEVAGNENWVGIVDELSGGIIIYCHHETAPRVLAALELQRAAEQVPTLMGYAPRSEEE